MRNVLSHDKGDVEEDLFALTGTDIVLLKVLVGVALVPGRSLHSTALGDEGANRGDQVMRDLHHRVGRRVDPVLILSDGLSSVWLS